MKKILWVFIMFAQVVHSVDISEKEDLYKDCDKGNIKACFEFAEFYQSGIYSHIYDHSYYKITIEPYRKACNGGIARACFRLGDRYVLARGVERNASKGYRLVKKACDMNDSWACSDLGFIYHAGYSSILKEDHKKALKFYEKACTLSKSVSDCNERDKLLKKLNLGDQ